jgi:alpha-L-fucosidase
VGRITKKAGPEGTTLYLHVFKWPADGKLTIPAVKGAIESATLLNGGAKLEAASEGGQTTIKVPATGPDKISSTVVVKVKGSV